MTLVFQERQPLERWVSYLVWLGIWAYVMMAIAATLLLHPPALILIGAFVSFIAFVFAAYNFRSLNIRIENDGISFGFGVFRKHIRWNEIESISVQPYLFSRFLGWGIVLDLRGTIGFIARRSLGVELKLKNGRKYFFSTWHPYELADLIRSRLNQSESKK